ncbi:MAG: hypothetical protein AMXMBFR84_19330 [Candidatus Hydrogenedentota bacterium]
MVNAAVCKKYLPLLLLALLPNFTCDPPSNSQSIVPDLVGTQIGEVDALLSAAGLTRGSVFTDFQSGVAMNTVYQQNPPAGAAVVPGTLVHLLVSLGDLLPKITEVSSQQGVPGEIIRIEFADAQGNSLLVGFNNIRVTPILQTESYLTVQVPPIAAGTYDLNVAFAESPEVKASVDWHFIVNPQSVPAMNEAEAFLNSVQSLLDGTRRYVEQAAEMSGVLIGELHQIDDDFDTCDRFLQYARIRLSQLSVPDRQLLCSLLAGSGVPMEVTPDAKSAMKDGDGTKAINPAALMFFASVIKLDAMSAGTTNLYATLDALKYGALASGAQTSWSHISASQATNLCAFLDIVQIPLLAADYFMDCVVPTDIKQITASARPDQGNRLNPGETSTLSAKGNFGAQVAWADVEITFTADGMSRHFAESYARALGQFTLIPAELRAQILGRVTANVGGVFAGMGFAANDPVFFALHQKLAIAWGLDVPVDVHFYRNNGDGSLSNAFKNLIPVLGEGPSQSLQALLLNTCGTSKGISANASMKITDESVLSFDATRNKLHAKRIGSTEVSLFPYRFEEESTNAGIATVEGWYFLQDEVPAGSSGKSLKIAEKGPLVIPVSSQSDMVFSPLTRSPVSGLSPRAFTPDGGSFEISLTPVDLGDRLYTGSSGFAHYTFGPVVIYEPESTEPIENDPPGGGGDPEVGEGDPVMPNRPPVSIAFLVDGSASMILSDPENSRILACKELVKILLENDEVAIFDFGPPATDGFKQTRLLQAFTTDKDDVLDALDRVTSVGGSPMYTSLMDVIPYISNTANLPLKFILLTDGRAFDKTIFESAVRVALDYDVSVNVVGLGRLPDYVSLMRLAERTGGHYTQSRTVLGLRDLLLGIGLRMNTGSVNLDAALVFIPAVPPGDYFIEGSVNTHIDGATITSYYNMPVTVEP